VIDLPQAQKGERLRSSIDHGICKRAKCRNGMQTRHPSALAKLPSSIAMPFAFHDHPGSPVLDAVLPGTNWYRKVLTSVNQKTRRRFCSQGTFSRCSPNSEKLHQMNDGKGTKRFRT
jgi:hypothetical protein